MAPVADTAGHEREATRVAHARETKGGAVQWAVATVTAAVRRAACHKSR
jgi:hypothetical protein